MKLRDLLKRSWINFCKNKQRTILTVMGTAIGAAAIITMVSVTSGLRDKVINNYIDNSDILKIEAQWKANGEASGDTNGKDIELIRKITGIKSASIVGLVEYNGSVKNSSRNLKPIIVAIDRYSLKSINKLITGTGIDDESSVIVGKNFLKNPLAGDDRNYEIVLSDSSKEIASPNISVHITGIINTDKPYLTEDISKNDSGDYPEIMYIPIERVDQISDSQFFIKQKKYIIEVKDINSMDYVLQQLKNMNLQVRSVYEGFKGINKIFMLIQVILGILGGITLIVSAIGTANTMSMAVMERKKEIGIIKAIGTKLLTIRIMFIIEAMYIGVIGAALGTVLSYVFSYIINIMFSNIVPYEIFQIGKLSSISVTSIIITVVMSIFINILASSKAVKMAVSVDTLSTLREE